LDHGGWYDRKSKEKPFNRIEDVMIVAAMGPPGGGRSVITPRIQRHFNVLTYTDLQFESIETIFVSILSAFYYNFSDDIKSSIRELVLMTLRVYDKVLNGPLKPTPNKSHYTFNLRDISRIAQGLCRAENRSCSEPIQVVRMWVHENNRVFGDRLIDDKDRSWLNGLLTEQATKTFKLDNAEVMNSKRLVYGDYMDGIEVETRVYRQVTDLKLLVEKIIEYLEEYNGSVKNQMKLVMFLDACEHVSRITRVVRQPLGNALLLGVGGSGRQSLSRLATYIANFSLY
jgi:dynein heavy chain